MPRTAGARNGAVRPAAPMARDEAAPPPPATSPKAAPVAAGPIRGYDRFQSGQLCRWLPGVTESPTDEDLLAAYDREATVVVLDADYVEDGDREDLPDGVGEAGVWVHDGARARFVPWWALSILDVGPADAPRILAHAAASPSPRCAPGPPSRWAWLTPAGLRDAAAGEVQVPRAAVPHVVGRAGRIVREAEEKLGVIIGIMDLKNGEALVTVLGPQDHVDAACTVVQWLAKGARSVLTRLAVGD